MIFTKSPVLLTLAMAGGRRCKHDVSSLSFSISSVAPSVALSFLAVTHLLLASAVTNVSYTGDSCQSRALFSLNNFGDPPELFGTRFLTPFLDAELPTPPNSTTISIDTTASQLPSGAQGTVVVYGSRVFDPKLGAVSSRPLSLPKFLFRLCVNLILCFHDFISFLILLIICSFSFLSLPATSSLAF